MRSDAKHKGNNKPLADYLPIIATVFFTIISFISSYSGIHALMGSVGNALVAFVFAGLFTLALQLMLVYAVFSFKKSHRAGAKFHWLSIYLICVFFSVGFGYSFWFEHIRVEDYAKEVYSGQINANKSKLTVFEQSYTQLASTLNNLAEYSKRIAKKEKEHGGTCDANSPPGDGPRKRLREQDAETFKGFLPHFEQQRDKIRETVTSVRAETENVDLTRLDEVKRTLNEAVHEANGLKRDPQFEQLKAVLKRRIEAGRRGFTRDGETFTCEDQVLEAQGLAIQNIDLPELKEVRFLDPADSKAILFLAFGRLMQLPALSLDWVPDLKPQDREEMVAARRRAIQQASQESEAQSTEAVLTQADALPLLLGCMVDLLIFISTVGGGAAESRNSPLRGLTQMITGSAPAADPGTWQVLKDYVEGKGTAFFHTLLWRYQMPFHHNRYVIVPFPAKGAEQEQLQRLLEAFRVVKAARLKNERLATALLPKWWVQSHALEMTDVDYVNLYELNPRFSDELLIEALHSCRQASAWEQETPGAPQSVHTSRTPNPEPVVAPDATPDTEDALHRTTGDDMNSPKGNDTRTPFQRGTSGISLVPLSARK